MWQTESSRIEQRRFRKRVSFLTSFVFFAFSVLYLRLFQLQVISARRFKKISKENCIQVLFQQAPRGTILDRKGKVLVNNRSAFSLLFSSLNLSETSIKKSIDKISNILEVDKEYLAKQVEAQKWHPFSFACLIKDIKREKMFQLAEEKPNIPGINIQTETVRYYTNGDFASHILGYIGEVDSSELRKSGNEYKIGNVVGKNGIEKVYDSELRGTEGGKQIEVNVVGRQLRVLREIEPIKGNTLVLTIDYRLQKVAEESLGDLSGAVVILDPQSGEILSLVSKPSFNPNIFTIPLTEQEWNYFFTTSSYPLVNRAIQAQYAPGSTFKIVVAIAALEEEKITPFDTFFCRGSFKSGREQRIFGCWRKEGHGREDIVGGLADSCDVYFYNVGLKTGVWNITKFAKKFGLGRKTGINLPSEKGGILPNPDWKRKKVGEPWFEGDTLNLSIGQGYLLVTPLQMANLMSCIVNGGKLYRPYIVKRILDNKNRLIKEMKPHKIRDVKISDETLSIIKKSLKVAVEKGTGRATYLKNLSVGGKTGTAENPHGENHAWFLSFAPVEFPQIVICVLVEHGGSGGAIAAPITRKILKGSLPFLGEWRNN